MVSANLAKLDREFANQVQKMGYPGAALCIAKDGKVLLNRGYGWSDKEKKRPVTPQSVFRIASLSKPITAIAVLKLCQDGRLKLSDKFLSFFPELKPLIPQRRPDPRLREITVQNLLQCSSGWDADLSGDPMFGTLAHEAAGYSRNLRPTIRSILNYWMARPLEFDPGTRYAYSNLSYAVLGEIVSKVSGLPYTKFVEQTILQPLGLTSMRPGDTAGSAAQEVKYYSGDTFATAIVPNVKSPVSGAYGSDFYLEYDTACFGWLSTAEDLVKFGTAFGIKSAGKNVLNEQYWRFMVGPPTYVGKNFCGQYFASGWEVERTASGIITEMSRHGSLAGTQAFMACRRDGYVWAVLLNEKLGQGTVYRQDLTKLIDGALGNIHPGNAQFIQSTGFVDPSLQKLDNIFAAKLVEHGYPGATFCVAKNGKILLRRGYGWANREKGILCQPDSTFRIASISKPLTAIAILSLCQDGKLKLDQKAFPLLRNLKPTPRGIRPDKRLYTITLRHLLQCSAGWDSAGGSDPFFSPFTSYIANMSETMMPTVPNTISYWMEQPLLFEPGSRFSYSNLCYGILGEIVASTSGMSYIAYVQERILRPLGMTQTVPGYTLTEAPNEVRYYSEEPNGNRCVPGAKEIAAAAYGGGFCVECMTATAGWVSTAPDLVKLGIAFNGPRPLQKILNDKYYQIMLSKPSFEIPSSDEEYFGMGWEVQRDSKGNIVDFSRHGSLAGCMSLICCRRDGIVWAALFNTRPIAYVPCREDIKAAIKDCLDHAKDLNAGAAGKKHTTSGGK